MVINLDKLLEIQQQRDERFPNGPETHRNGCLWLATEIAELANAWGGFKYRYRHRQSVDKNQILLEYVDGLAVLLSLGLYRSFFPLQPYTRLLGDRIPKNASIVHQFMKLIRDSWRLYDWDLGREEFAVFFHTYMDLGGMLGLTWADIESAYIAKQKLNESRQAAHEDH